MTKTSVQCVPSPGSLLLIPAQAAVATNNLKLPDLDRLSDTMIDTVTTILVEFCCSDDLSLATVATWRCFPKPFHHDSSKINLHIHICCFKTWTRRKSNYGLVLAIFSAFMMNLHHDPKLEGLSLTRMTPLSS
jgi:hypothetical protein